MVTTHSAMVPLGYIAPQFSLPEPLSKQTISFDAVCGEYGTVVMFICNHCPFVKHVQEELVRVASDYGALGVGFVAINSNDVQGYPDDSPDKMAEDAQRLGYPFPYLFDETQEVAKAYSAACTPDFFVYDAEDKLVYRGQLDSSRPGIGEADGRDLRNALDHLLSGNKVITDQHPSVGCNIKWK